MTNTPDVLRIDGRLHAINVLPDGEVEYVLRASSDEGDLHILIHEVGRAVTVGLVFPAPVRFSTVP